eukprot:7281711-Karenia_brevis.AAC.1
MRLGPKVPSTKKDVQAAFQELLDANFEKGTWEILGADSQNKKAFTLSFGNGDVGRKRASKFFDLVRNDGSWL